MLAVDLVRRGAQRYRDRTAVVVGDQEMTFRDVDEMSNRIANVLVGMGRRKVGLLLNNGLWSIPVDFGCLKAGVARVPLNSRLSLAEHARMLEETGADLLIYGEDLAGRAQEIAGTLDGLRLAGLGTGDLDLITAAEGASAADPAIPIAPDDVTLILYTSGTTGTLKAAQHTQASYAAIAANILANLLSPGRDDAMLHAASLIHASGTFVLPYWYRGGRSVVLPGFDPQQYARAIEAHRVTCINLVPTMLTFLLGTAAGADLSSLRTIVYGASPAPRPLLEQCLDFFGHKLVQYYGQTEAPLCISVLDQSDHEDPALLGSCGHPAIDAEIRLMSGEGAQVATGEIGEVWVRAPFTMAGYFNAPELTRETMTPDGWIRTRDLARSDDRGYLYLVDRASDMIITGGYNVYPREVEDALMAHPAVAECAVVGTPDPTWVEAVTGFVALRPGASVTAEELQATVRGELAGYKVPKRIHFVDAIPKSPVGKILRRALRDG